MQSCVGGCICTSLTVMLVVEGYKIVMVTDRVCGGALVLSVVLDVVALVQGW